MLSRTLHRAKAARERDVLNLGQLDGGPLPAARQRSAIRRRYELFVREAGFASMTTDS